MFDFVNIPIFLSTSLLINMSPGVNFMNILGKGVLLSKKEALKASFGIFLSSIIYSIVCAAGISSLVNSSSFGYEIMKEIGSVYLIYLGVESVTHFDHLRDDVSNKKINSFWQSFLINITDPQVFAVYLIIIPHFIQNNHSKDHFDQATILGIIYGIVALFWFSLVAILSGSLGLLIKNNIKIQFIIKVISGIILASLGVLILRS